MINDNETQKLSGTVDSIVFRSEESGFAVIKVISDNELITFIGDFGNIEVGEELTCSGRYEDNSRFGRQFRAEHIERSLPTSSSAIQRYLSGGIVKGISAVLAKKIVEKFGEQTLEIIENEPDRLAEVDGISHKKAAGIYEEFRKTFAVRSLMTLINSYELPASVSIRSWKLWGEGAEELISGNPYVLCREGVDVSFTRADSIAKKLEIPESSKERIAAGLTWILRELANEGHTAVPLETLREKALTLLGTDTETWQAVLDSEL